MPFVFTEQGVAMLSSVLNSERAVEINIQIMRAFVRLREMIASNKDLARKLDALERKLESHDVHIRSLFEAIRQLMTLPEPKKRKIGFLVEERAARYGTHPALIAEAQKGGWVIEPVSGDELQSLGDRLMVQPAEVVNQVKMILRAK